MFFHIDPTNGLAIYDQIVRQVKFSIATGALQPGSLVSSVRELARELAINPNTVARAYQQLQADGVLEPVRGLGLAVTRAAVEHCRRERQKLTRTRIHQALAEAYQSGLAADQIRRVVDSELESILQKGGTRHVGDSVEAGQ